MTRDEIRASFPNLADTFRLTSKPDRNYNCVAWAVGETHRRWDPDGYFWPPDVPRDWKLSSVIQALQMMNFEVCADGKPERGYEKLAVYCESEDEVLHAARLLEDGWWTSKLGDFDDIKHRNYSELEHTKKGYGSVMAFVRRKIAASHSGESEKSSAK